MAPVRRRVRTGKSLPPRGNGGASGLGRGLGTVQWGEAERQQVLEYLLEGFGNMHDELLDSV